MAAGNFDSASAQSPRVFTASRIGRGVALNRRQRADIWPVFEEMREQLARGGFVTAEDAVHYALELLNQGDDSVVTMR